VSGYIPTSEYEYDEVEEMQNIEEILEEDRKN